MARQVLETLVDDLDGSTADETIELSLDGTAYEIDLTTAHATCLRQVLAPYVAAARRAGGVRAVARRRPGRARSREETTAIRDWAGAHGFTVSRRGRIPREVLNAYHNRTNDAAPPHVAELAAEPAAATASATGSTVSPSLAPKFVSEAAPAPDAAAGTVPRAEPVEGNATRGRRSQKPKSQEGQA